MSTCKVKYIEDRLRSSNPQLADELTDKHIQIFDYVSESKAFNKKDGFYYLNKEGTKKRVKQLDVISSINKTHGNVASVKTNSNGDYFSTDLLNSNPIRRDLISQTYFNGRKEQTTMKMIDLIIESKSPMSEVAKKLKPYIKYNHPIKLVSLIDNNSNYYGEFSNNTREIQIRDGIKNPETTIIHEILHALTEHELHQNEQTEVSLHFTNLYNHALAASGSTMYALSNESEFLVGLFTDNALIKELKLLPPMSTDTSYTNLFQEIFDFILKMFGFTNENSSLYNQAFSAATHIIDQQYKKSDSKGNRLLSPTQLENIPYMYAQITKKQEEFNSERHFDKVNNLIQNKEKEIDYHQELIKFTQNKYFIDRSGLMHYHIINSEYVHPSSQMYNYAKNHPGWLKYLVSDGSFSTYEDMEAELDIHNISEEEAKSAYDESLRMNYNHTFITIEKLRKEIQDLKDFTKEKAEIKQLQRQIELFKFSGAKFKHEQLNSLENVKPGVEELFDSNPELANAVYEALGFNQLITSNDRIVFGHPTIGKSFLKNQGEDKFISLDDDYATEINSKVKEIADKYNVTTYQVKDGGTQKWNNEYNQMMQEMFNVAKQKAISENKTLFTSNTNLLRNNAESFDKIINLTDKEFERRIQERGAKYDIKEWKSQINEAISKLPTNKVINTDKYLSDLFITPQQKQQALQLYSQYLDTGKQDIEGFKEYVSNNNSILFQNQSSEGIIASEKTIRDLAARMSDRIGMPVKFESDRTLNYKGKIENNVVYINLAYATLDTPIHEILGHPIIRSIKDKRLQVLGYNKNFENQGEEMGMESKPSSSEIEKRKTELNNLESLYNNLLKELETGIGKEVLDRIKRDYNNKNQFKKEDFSIQEEEHFDIDAGKRIKRFTVLNSKIPYTSQTIFKNIEDAQKEMGRLSAIQPYTLEEQQEEAIVELLGLMTAEKLDKVKDGKLISLLKRLLKEIKAFMKQLLSQREVDIDKLPDNMTLGDLSDLLAYSNSKLILPGNEVIYTTPDNQTFSTYQEASNHISKLAKDVKDVDLGGIKINTETSEEQKRQIKQFTDELKDLRNQFNNFKFEKIPFSNKIDIYTEKGRLRQNYWARKEDGTTGYLGRSKETLTGDDYDGFVLDKRGDPNAVQNREYVKISDDEAKKIFDEVNDTNTATRASIDIYNDLASNIDILENRLNALEEGSPLKNFISKNKEYEQSKEIIEEWKKVNNIQYNPEEIYSRGQEFSSVVGAYSNFDVNLMMQNLLSHIEDNEKAGGKFAISAYTKPVDKQINHLEGGGGKIKFKIYPKSEDILWASNIDVFSGSVWDASEKINKDKKSELLGISYTKYPSLNHINSIKPNLASIVDDIGHGHNELGIVLTNNNFRLEYDEDIPYQTKKIINSINNILDQKYGLVDKKIHEQFFTEEYTWDVVNLEGELIKTFYDSKKMLDFVNKKAKYEYLEIVEYKKRQTTIIQPTMTKESLNKTINDIKDLISNYEYNTNLENIKNMEYQLEYHINKLKKEKEELLKYKSTIFNIFDLKAYNVEDYLKTIKKVKLPFSSVLNNIEISSEKVIYKNSSTVNPINIIIDKKDFSQLLFFVKQNSINKQQKNIDTQQEYIKSYEEYLFTLKNKSIFFREPLDYSSQALINIKISVLKEVSKKYPRSLIRSEVKRINTSSSQELYDQFGAEDLPLQKVPSQDLTLNINDEDIKKFSNLPIKLQDFIGTLTKNELNSIVDTLKEYEALDYLPDDNTYIDMLKCKI